MNQFIVLSQGSVHFSIRYDSDIISYNIFVKNFKFLGNFMHLGCLLKQINLNQDVFRKNL